MGGVAHVRAARALQQGAQADAPPTTHLSLALSGSGSRSSAAASRRCTTTSAYLRAAVQRADY